MANHRKHITRALHNEALLKAQVLEADYPDWYITVAFYAGVHWIRALLALNQIGHLEHVDLHYDEFNIGLREIVRSKAKEQPITSLEADTSAAIKEFRELRDLARNSRYRCNSMGEYARLIFEADTSLAAVRKFVTAYGIIP